MISEQNYYESIRQVDMSNWPESLKKGHTIIDSLSYQGKRMDKLKASENIYKAVQEHFKRVEAHLKGESQVAKSLPAAKKPEPVKAEPEKKEVRQEEKAVSSKGGPKSPPPSKEETEPDGGDSEMVELVSDEVRLLKRYYNMLGKTRTREQLLSYLKALQKAITERRIRKTSPYADAIREIQRNLVEFFNETRKQSLLIEVSDKTEQLLEKAVDSQELYPSIAFIKRFIGLHGKEDIENKAQSLLDSLTKAIEKGKIDESDRYFGVVNGLQKRLAAFLEKPTRRMEIPASELNGLMGIADGIVSAIPLTGLGELYTSDDDTRIMNSLDFVKQEFPTIGLRGKWLSFIGDPSPGFTAMVFGRPKMGKSYLCIDFAGYLAKYHGKVLYVAKEEKLHDTLKRKLVEMRVSHTNLDVVAGLPADLSPYQFIFFDSVNKLGLKPSQLESLESEYPDKSFIYVFQTVKTGAFRGDNGFQHHVDVVIEVPKKGHAIQYGRFNQGGEMNIFPGQQEQYKNAA